MTGSTKPGDAKADVLRDEFRRNRALRRAALDSLPDDDANAEDTQRLQAVLADSKTPAAVRGAVGFLAAFPERHRIPAALILGLFVLALVAIGGAKLLGLV